MREFLEIMRTMKKNICNDFYFVSSININLD